MMAQEKSMEVLANVNPSETRDGFIAQRFPESVPCTAVVWKRDTYRRTGRGKTGFELHQKRCRCRREGKDRFGGRCFQHKDKHSFRDF